MHFVSNQAEARPATIEAAKTGNRLFHQGPDGGPSRSWPENGRDHRQTCPGPGNPDAGAGGSRCPLSEPGIRRHRRMGAEPGSTRNLGDPAGVRRGQPRWRVARGRTPALVGAHPDIPVVMMGESEDSHYVAGILAQGARGYIPTSVSLSVAIGALCLAMAGGVFVPASALRNSGHERPEREQTVHSLLGLSERQGAVADAVALGKPNKIIAYELGLCESTVKVHIRTIMKKLHARNRTEVAFKLHAAKTRAA